MKANSIVLAIAGFFMFTLMDLSVKWLLNDYSLVQVTFLTCFFAMVGLLAWTFPNFHLLKTTRPKVHLSRAVLVLFADLLAFYSYGEIEIAQAYTLILTMPLFTVVLAIGFGYESFNPTRIAVSFVGFIGILFVLTPGYGAFNIAMLAALGCAMLEAFTALVVAHHKDRETPQAFAFYSLSLITLVTGIASVFSFTPMTFNAVSISLIGGTSYASGSASVIMAFQKGRPSAISSIQYSQLLWGLLFGYLIWGELPEALAILGGAIVVCSGLFLIRLNNDS